MATIVLVSGILVYYLPMMLPCPQHRPLFLLSVLTYSYNSALVLKHLLDLCSSPDTVTYSCARSRNGLDIKGLYFNTRPDVSRGLTSQVKVLGTIHPFAVQPHAREVSSMQGICYLHTHTFQHFSRVIWGDSGVLLYVSAYTSHPCFATTHNGKTAHVFVTFQRKGPGSGHG